MNQSVVGTLLNSNPTAAARSFATRRLTAGAGMLATLLAACGGQPENTLADARAALEEQFPAKAIDLLKPYISKHVEDGMARALLAEALLDSGNVEEGRRELSEADRLRAPRGVLRVSECRVAAITMTLDEAMGRCAAAQGETPTERASLHLHSAFTQLAAQHPVAAIAQIRSALQERPAWLLALRALAVAQAQAGDDAAATQTVAEVFKLAPSAPETLHLQGELAFMRGQYVVAAAAFAKAADAATVNPAMGAKAREHQVQALLLAEQPKPAIEVAAGLARRSGASLLDQFLYGYALASDGQFMEARNTLEELLLKDPNLAQAKIIVAISLLGLGQAGQAEMYLRNVLIELPENVLALAALEALKQQPLAPEQAFKRVQAQFNGAEQDPQWLAWGGLLELRQPPEVVSDEVHLLHQKVMVLLNNGNRPGALALVKAELARREKPETLAEYAALIAATDFAGAQKAMARALELDRDNVEVLNAYGELFLAAGKPLEAMPHLERAAKIAPRNPEVHYHLALAYFATGNRSAARDAVSEALRGGHMFDDRRAAETLAEVVGAR